MSADSPSWSEGTIETRTHGRFLVAPGSAIGAPLLLGFHGYAETAEEELQRLRAIPGIEPWTIVSIQGLHQFYRRRTGAVVASWMTRQNRELAIADNALYVSQVLRQVSEQRSAGVPVVTTGFSQGASMAYRAAVSVDSPIAGVMTYGGDVPPELDTQALARIPVVLIGRGNLDEWYTREKQASDEGRLRAAGVHVFTMTFEAGHEWAPPFNQECSRFLQTLLAGNSTL